MTSAEIRQSFLDFFQSKQHTIVPSASLMPTAPNLLFTNAGMNQFVPYFLGDQTAPWKRVADTQKCIRAGGKHNDLEDVGYDTYHHTLFEMLGNWSFGDYFKKESLTWGWELLTKVWGIPPKRLFATVYSPDKAKGDPADFDQEAYDIWAGLFRAAGLDPQVHIVNGNKKDNFWMMGDTGPCGPCSEVHFNLLPSDDETAGRKLVNSSSPRCIEIWNHVFIQFNANADGSFAPLAAKHVDTGMGFERVAGIYASSKGFTDFTAEPSNYAASLFTPLFAKIAELSGETYHATVPRERTGLNDQENIDVAFRVLADHARCVTCAVADGILPGNEGRNYVIRRILRRGILYGKKLDLEPGFFSQLVDAVVDTLGGVFPELKQNHKTIRRVILAEEESFGRTLDRGMERFYQGTGIPSPDNPHPQIRGILNNVSGKLAFELYDTYGFPLDMTQLLATENEISVDAAGFEAEMEKQRERGRAAQKKDVIVATTEGTATAEATKFVGYELEVGHAIHATLVDVVKTEKATFLVFDQTPFYAEMGGQVGDAGHALINGAKVDLVDCVKDKAGRHLHKVAVSDQLSAISPGAAATLSVDLGRRRAITRHHSATHLLQWALRKVLGTHVRQSGTHKTPERLRFDFSHFEAVTAAQLLEVEQLVNAKVIDNSRVVSAEIEFAKKPDDVLAFFGDKYGKYVRVVDIGGFSKELCGGTHVATTGEIGVIKISAEMAIAAGTRRIEAVAGQPALDFIAQREAALAAVSAHLSAGPVDVAKKLETLLAHQKELEKQLKAFHQRESAEQAKKLAENPQMVGGLKIVRTFVSDVASMESLKDLSSNLSSQGIDVVHLFARTSSETISNVSSCSHTAINSGWKANTLVSQASKILGGKGGGKPDFAMGGGKDESKIPDALQIRP
jgi:alanyl-tRNA synthetase